MPDALIVWCEALAQTPLSLFFQNIAWLIPLVQTVHILAIAVVMGSAGMIDLGVLGLAARSQPAREMAGRLLPAAWCALAVLLCSGAVLAIAEPLRSLVNPAFQLKMLLLLFAVSLTAFLQSSLRREAAAQGLGLKLAAGASLLLWVGIIFAGRWIAYIEAGVA